ncbi:helix-turn-helix transcriptional regulator [Streptomyces sp. NPDC054797]
MTEDLGTLLRRLRDQANLTQEQVAERSGVSVRTIRRLESGGSTNHRMGTVNLLADALGLEEGDRLLLAAALTSSSTGPEGAGADPGPGDGPGPRPGDRDRDGLSIPGPAPALGPEPAPEPTPPPGRPSTPPSPTPRTSWRRRSGAAGAARRRSAASTTRSPCPYGGSRRPPR